MSQPNSDRRPKLFDRAKFDHVGFITTEKRPNEIWLAAERRLDPLGLLLTIFALADLAEA